MAGGPILHQGVALVCASLLSRRIAIQCFNAVARQPAANVLRSGHDADPPPTRNAFLLTRVGCIRSSRAAALRCCNARPAKSDLPKWRAQC